MAYLRQRTWLESGPARSRLGVCRGRGFGSIFDIEAATGLSQTQVLQYELGGVLSGALPLIATDAQIIAYIKSLTQITNPLPAPTAPSLTPVPPTTPGAVYSGSDASGNPVYLAPSTPQQDQASTVQSLQSYFSSLAPSASGSDCSGWFAQQFSSACGGSSVLLWVGGAALVGLFFLGRRRR